MTGSVGEPIRVASQKQWPGAGSTTISRWLSERSASRQAAFLLPHLHEGMDLLDCGCGPGSITAGLARAVAPGRVVGIDLDASKIDLARAQAAAHDLPNLRFEAADIHALPFADVSFDAVFSNAVLTYSPKPLTALQEIYRVLKPGGMIGIRNVDYDGHLFTPTPPLLTRFWKLFVGIQERRGDNPYLGKHQRSLLLQSGFANIQSSATYECYGTEETAQKWGEMVTALLQEDNMIVQLMELGAEPPEIEQMGRAWREWGEQPDAFFADAYCEAVAWKA